MKKDNKNKKFHTYKKLTLLAVVLILVGILAMALALIISSSVGNTTGGFIMGAIILVVCIFLSIIVFNKRRYYCPRCGSKYRKTGNYRETGDIELASSKYSTTVSEWLHVEYECPVCQTSKIIVEKHKVGRYS